MQNDFINLLRELNLKITPKRLAILDVLDSSRVYMSPDEVRRDLLERFGTIGLPTVYRNLEELAAGGVISTILHPDRKLYYFFCQNRNHHHHFVCLSCRTVEEIEWCDLEQVKKSIQGKILSHIIQVNGLCRKCAGQSDGSEI